VLPNHLEERLADFESQWGTQAHRSIAEVLTGVDCADRLILLAELVMTDVELHFRKHADREQCESLLVEHLRHYSELDDHLELKQKIVHHCQEIHNHSQDAATLVTGPATDDMQTRSPADLTPPCQFGKFHLLRVAGSGGMATVFEAQQQEPRRIVAVKVLYTGLNMSGDVATRFEREIQLVSKIEDPGIVPLYESGTIGDHRYFVMPFYHDGSLRDRIQEAQLTPHTAAHIMRELATAVASAHRMGIVHRDLKPGNVMFGPDGRAMIADFGLSRETDHSASLTDTGQFLGTPGYIAPERILNRKVDRSDTSSDIYALGAILYDALCGRPPFRGATVWETLSQAMSDSPVSPTRLNPQVDADLNTICLKCLEQVPEQRYPSCTKLAEDLDHYLKGELIWARRPGRWERAKRYVARHPARSGLLGTSTLIVIVAFVAIYLAYALSVRNREFLATELVRRAESYGALLATAGQQMSERRSGWRATTLASLREASELDLPGRDLTLLRTMVASASVQRDLEPIATLAVGMWCDTLAFGPRGRFLALGQNRDTDGFRVVIYDVSDLQTDPFTLWVDCAEENNLRRQEGHIKPEDGARALQFSPDGTVLAIGTRHGRLHLYRWTGQQAEYLESHDPDPDVEVLRLQFSRDGNTLFALSDKQTLRQVRNGRVESVATFGDNDVASFVVSPTEDALFVLQADGTTVLRIDGDGTEPTWQLDAYTVVRNVSISIDGRFLGVACENGQHLVMVDTTSGLQRTTVFGERSNVVQSFGVVAHGHTGDWIVSTQHDRIVQVWDVDRGNVIATHVVAQRGGRPRIATSPNDALIAVTEHMKVTLFRITGTDILQSLEAESAAIQNIEFNAVTGRLATIVSRSRGGITYQLIYGIRDVKRGHAILRRGVTYHTAPNPSGPWPLRFTADGSRLLTVGKVKRPLVIPSIVMAPDATLGPRKPDSFWISSAEIDFIDAEFPQTPVNSETLSAAAAVIIPKDFHHVRFSLPRLPESEFEGQSLDEGRNVYVVCRLLCESSSVEIRITAQSNNKVILHTLVPTNADRFVALCIGNHRLLWNRPALQVTLDFDQPVQQLIVEGVLVRRGKLKDSLDGIVGDGVIGNDDVVGVSAVVHHEPTNTIWTVANEENLVVTDYPEFNPVAHWANESVSHDAGRGTLWPLLTANRWVVAGTTGGEIFVFDAGTQQMVTSGTPLNDRVASLCTIPDLQQMVVGGSDGSIRLLDLPLLTHRQLLHPHDLSVDALCFDPRRKWLITGSEDGSLAVFERVGKRLSLLFQIKLGLGRVQRLCYMPQKDCLAVLIRNETAVRLIQLGPMCKSLRQLGLLNGTPD
jgi:WD40 repeat protein